MVKKLSSSERKQQILEIVTILLTKDEVSKITTANIAKIANVSEATLYRHFKNKEEIFASLIDFVEESILIVINKINDVEQIEILQLKQILVASLRFAENNPGIINLLINCKTITKSNRLSEQTNKFFYFLEIKLKNNLVNLPANYNLDCKVLATILSCFIIGKWHKFVYQGFEKLPLDDWNLQWQQLEKLLTT